MYHEIKIEEVSQPLIINHILTYILFIESNDET